jgi:hypothetical protein
LDICSLGELISMYRAHNATQRHDRIYALLGMSTDDLSTARISPNYSVRWEELLRRLATFVLGEKISVRVGENEEDLGIIGRGCIVGDVETVSRDKNGNQTIVVNYTHI